MEVNLVNTIIQGGAVGLALVLTWVVYKLSSNHMVHTQDIIKGTNRALRGNTKVLGKMSLSLDRNTNVLENLEKKIK